jgi:hypothetical protein
MNINWRKRRGMTLSEVLIAVCILITAVSALLLAYANCFILADSVRNTNIATNFAQGVIEGLRNYSFPTDANADGKPDITNIVITHDNTDYYFVQGSSGTFLYRCSFPIADILPSGRCWIYIDYDYDNDGVGETDLLELTVSVCWKQKGRVIGEDKDLDGVLDSGEDANGNGMIDSSVELKTRWTNR